MRFTKKCTQLPALLLLFLLNQAPVFAQSPSSSDEKLELEDRMDLANEHEVEMTMDPALGFVPRERLLVAQAYLESLQGQNRAPLAGINWIERGPNNIAGRTRSLLIDANDATGNTVWVGGVGGGLWKTTDITLATPTWTVINDQFDNLAVTTIAQHPGNAQIIYFGTGEGWFNLDAVRGLGIWKTTNGGATWTMLAATNNSNFYYVQKVVVAANGDVFAATRDGGVQRSQDGGTTWTKVLGSGATAATNRAADIEIASNGDIYATMGIFNQDGIYKSVNGGTTWTKLTGGLPTTNYYRIEIACAPSNSNRLYALFHNATTDGSLGVYTTVNGGTTWTAVTNPNYAGNQAWYDLTAAVDPNNESRVLIGGVTVWASSNAGSTWSQVSIGHTDQHGIIFKSGSSSIAYFVNDGGIYRSTNANAGSPTLSFKGKNYNVTQYYAADLNPASGSNEFLGGTQDNGSHRFLSAGMNTVTTVTGGDGGYCHIDQNQPNIQITSYVYNQFWITTNSWGTNTFYNVSSSKGRFINPTDYDDANNILYSCYDAGKYLRISGVGGTLTIDTLTISQFSGSTISAIKVSPNTSNRVFFGLSNGDVVRVDNANTASPTATIVRDVSSGYVSSIDIQPGNDNHILMCYSNYGVNSVWETQNAGTNWVSVEGNLPDMPIRWVLFSPTSNDQALVATELGVWTTDNLDGTATVWGPSNSGLANVRTDMLQSRSSDKLVLAATHGRGLFSTISFGIPPPLAVSPSNQNVSELAGTTTFTVTSNLSWSVTSNQPWLTVTPPNGSNNGMLTASFTDNPGNAIRIGTITATASGAPAVAVTVTQAGIPLPCSDSNEPANNTCNTGAPVIPFLTDFPSLIGSTTDNDYYRFTLSGAGTVQVQLFNLPFDYDLVLLNSNCVALATSENGNTESEYISLQLPAGDYYVRVYGYAGAFSTTDCYTLRVTAIVPPGISLTVTPVACQGGGNGAVASVASGGTPPYTYSWNNGQTTATATNLAAGTYTVTITDALNASATASATVTQPTTLTSSAAVVNVSCNGGANGSIALSVSGGTAPYTYLWNNGQTTATATGLAAATYSATITDANGCTSTKQATVGQPAAALTASATIANVSCNGGANGSIALNVSGGTAPYTYLWNNGQTAATATGLAAAIYSATITDLNGCTSTKQATVGQPPALASGATVVNASCNGGANGSVALNVSGGTAPYTYLWNNGQTGATATGLAAATYSATITDANGCTLTKQATVGQPAALASGTMVVDVSCNGGANGSVALNVSGGTAPYTYLWNNGQTGATATGLAAATYSATITDANGCTSTKQATVGQPAALASGATVVDVSCNGGANGSVALSVSGGTAPYTYLWNNGQTTATATGLAAATYSATITDANGCSSTKQATVGQPAALSSGATVVHVSCNGGANGSVALSVSGGTAPYTYLWNNSQTSGTAINLVAATYSATITDANGCTSTKQATVGQPAAALAASATIANVSCNGGANGSVALSVSGGTAPYTYLWNNGQTAATATGLAATTYSATITDANGCTSTKQATVGQPAALSSGATVVDISCNGGANGSVALSVSGGTAPYTYLWNNGQTAATATGLAATTYSATITDAEGCTSTKQATVGQPAALASGATVVDVSCNGGANGSIALSVSGGIAPYTYLWNNGQTTATATGLAAAAYSATITDANGCTSTKQATVGQPAVLASGTMVVDVTCNGGANGSVALSVSGGTAPYTYLWNNGQTSATATGLAAAAYSATITDANGCTSTKQATVSQPAAALAASATIANVSCNGGANGSIALSVSGGTAPYTYLWNNGQTGVTATGLAAVTYSATITDANGCSSTKQATVGQPAVLASGATIANVSCNGGANGSIALSVSGGTAPYTYLWNNGQTGATATGLAAAAYSATITDANGCTSTKQATVGQPAAALAASATIANVSCNGGANGSIALSVSGGTAPYTYLWNNGQTAATATGLAAAAYSATITDANGCTSTKQATVGQPAAALAASATIANVSCNGGANGSIALSVSGGTAPYTYLWNNGQTGATATSLAATTYSATITDANGCTSTKQATVGQPAAALAASATIANVSCNGGANGSIALSVSGGTAPYTYLWNNGQTGATATGLAAATYSATITDANGCTSTKQATVGQPAAALAASATIANVSCNGGANGSIALSVSGGTAPYTYLWNNGQTGATATGLAAATYSATITDANGCTSTKQATVGQPAGALAASATIANVSCNGGANGSVALSVSGGTAPYTFLWNNGQTGATATSLAAATYSATITDAKGCTSTKQATVGQPAALASGTTVVNVSCNGGANGSIALSVSGGTAPYTFLWNNGQTGATATGLAAATYSATITDANGCTSTKQATVGQPAALASGTTVVDVSCNGGANGSIALSVSGGTAPYTFLWNNGQTAATATGLAAATYSATITDANGCTSTKQATVGQPAALASGTTVVDVSCNGGANGSVALNVSGGTAPYTYLWNNGQTGATATGLAAATYSATVTDANGCSTTKSATVGQPAAALAASATIANVSCNGEANGSVALNVSGGTAPYTYLWSNNQTTPTAIGLPAGTYSATITDAHSCTATKQVAVTQPAAIELHASITNESCATGLDGQIALTASGGNAPYTYLWNNSQTGLVATGLEADIYTATVTDASGCAGTISATVELGLPNEAFAVAMGKVFLQGPYVSSVQLMHDSLRVKNLIPLQEPYTGLPNFTHVGGGGGEQTTAAVLAVTGQNAIVDWVFLELRNAANPVQVLATRSALLQRDGDVVDVDGVSPVAFGIPANQSYYFVVRHRNHLGVQLGAALSYPVCQTVVTDFTTLPAQGFFAFNGLNAAEKLVSNRYMLWAGNGRVDFQLKYNGSNNDRTTVLSVVGLTTPNASVGGYNLADYNLDGLVKYNGSANDRNVLLGNVGISTPSAILYDQVAQ